jgi:O-antigen/teichoic acid export membrane protein
LALNQIQNSLPITEEAWKRPGFHRPLAGLLHNLVYIFIASGFAIIITIWLMPNLIYPFPEAIGFENLTTDFFAIYFTILDLGIGSSVQKFVSEENVRNPRKSIQYFQFFIWYQMFSGLLQVTAITVWILFIKPGTNLLYTSWFFLFYSTIQYPGMLSIFRGGLEAFQRFDRAMLLRFIQTQIFQNLIRIVTILIGRAIGRNNPVIGELMGAAIGSIVGKILNEYVVAFIAGIWLHPILKEIDPSYGIFTFFRVDFDREVVRNSLFFGLKVLTPGLISPLTNFIALNLIIRYLPNYSTILGLYTFAEMIAYMPSTLKFEGIAATISEAYSNQKLNLIKYYFQEYFRWNTVVSGFVIGFLFTGSTLIGIIAGGNFSLVTPIIQHYLIWKMISVYANIVNEFFIGVGKPEYDIYLSIAENIVRIFVLWLMLVPFSFGWAAIVYSWGLSFLTKWLLGFLVIRLKILKVHINVWPTFGANFIAIAMEAGYISLLNWFLFPLLSHWMNRNLVAAIIMVIAISTGPFLIYFPIYSVVGGWDKKSLEVFELSYRLSGPSKFVVNVMLKGSIYFSKHSLFHPKISYKIGDVDKEIDELVILRKQRKNMT